MVTYLVRPDDRGATATLINGANALIVEAASTAEAALIAENLNAVGKFIDPIHYTSVNVSTLLEAEGATAKSDGWEGWEWRVEVDSLAPVTYTGAFLDGIPDIAAELVTGLNALAAIANAAWNLSTSTLTIAGAGDNLGDKAVTLEIHPPGSAVNISGLTNGITITDQGATGAALSADLSNLVADVTAVCGGVPLNAIPIRVIE